MSKYYLVAEYRSIFLRLMKGMLGLSHRSPEHHHPPSHRSIKPISRAPEFSEMRELSLVSMLQSHSLDPFSSVQQAGSGMSFHWKSGPSRDLLFDKAIGEKAHEIFCVQRLASQPANTKFHDTILKAKLQTFTDLNKKVQVKSKTSKEIYSLR